MVSFLDRSQDVHTALEEDLSSINQQECIKLDKFSYFCVGYRDDTDFKFCNKTITDLTRTPWQS